jgi:P27 family predicted phage terminase small subunit
VPRARKPLSLHSLQSTQPQYVATGESRVPASLPRPPKFLSKDAKKKFRALTKQLAERRVVTAGDADVISLYCSTWMRLLAAQKSIEEQGLIVTTTRLDSNGVAHAVERPNINLKIVETSERLLLSYLVRLGLTPKDRQTVRPTAPPEEPLSKREKTEQEIARLRAQLERDDEEFPSREEVVAEKKTDDTPDLDSIDETLADK